MENIEFNEYISREKTTDNNVNNNDNNNDNDNDNDKECYYKIDEYINSNLNEIHDITSLYICGYIINKNGKKPFLQFLLEKTNIVSHILNNQFGMVFPEIFITENNKIKEEITEFLEKNKIYNVKKINGFTKNENTNKTYLFVECDFVNKEAGLLRGNSRNREFWPVLIDEIVNHKKVSNIPIESSVINFLVNSVQFLYLYDKNNAIIEIPSVGYVCKPENKVEFTAMFGQTKHSSLSINSYMGQYYYFNDYDTCLENDEKSKYMVSYIIKFALFVGNVKIIMGSLEELEDKSEYKKYLLENTETYEIANLTRNITDYDGLWTNEYDSVFLGKIILDNGTKLEGTPLIVLKDYAQQLPLYYHCVSKIYNDEYNEKLIL